MSPPKDGYGHELAALRDLIEENPDGARKHLDKLPPEKLQALGQLAERLGGMVRQKQHERNAKEDDGS